MSERRNPFVVGDTIRLTAQARAGFGLAATRAGRGTVTSLHGAFVILVHEPGAPRPNSHWHVQYWERRAATRRQPAGR